MYKCQEWSQLRSGLHLNKLRALITIAYGGGAVGVSGTLTGVLGLSHYAPKPILGTPSCSSTSFFWGKISNAGRGYSTHLHEMESAWTWNSGLLYHQLETQPNSPIVRVGYWAQEKSGLIRGIGSGPSISRPTSHQSESCQNTRSKLIWNVKLWKSPNRKSKKKNKLKMRTV